MIMGFQKWKPAQSREAASQGNTARKSQRWDMTSSLCAHSEPDSYPMQDNCFSWEVLLLGGPRPPRRDKTHLSQLDHHMPL